MAEVKGAGDSGMRDNPSVTSKFDRDHGKPRSPGKVSHPGGTAKPTGSKHSGFNEHGHMQPREVGKLGTHTTEHIEAGKLGGMSDAKEHRREGNYLMTDSIRQETGEDSP